MSSRTKSKGLRWKDHFVHGKRTGQRLRGFVCSHLGCTWGALGVAAARPYRELGLSSIMVSWELEEEYGCVGRGVAGQLAIIALVARRRLDVYNKKGAPRVAVAAALGGAW